MNVVLAMDDHASARLLADDVRLRLMELASVDLDLIVTDFDAAASALATADVLLTCWGCPPITAEVLEAAPRLKAIIHAAGTVKHHVTPECFSRLAVSSAAAANALPVAEYTLAMILLHNKRVPDLARLYRSRRDFGEGFEEIGNYRRTVGIIGASLIGRRVIELLRPFDLDVLLFDPYVPSVAGARSCTLDELVSLSDVVSVHAPELPSTRHMIDKVRLARMRDGALLINTARGWLVDQEALTAELVSGRLRAVLDVTTPEPLPADSPLHDLPNVMLTPHVAGSLGGEIRRLAHHALDELERFTQGRPFAHPVHPESLDRSA